MNKTKRLNKENNLLDKQIREENQEIFTDMICYIRGSSISDYEAEVVRRDLTEMVLSAQSRGEDITSLFTGDYKQFCDEVIAAIPPKTRKENVIYALDTAAWCLALLLGINILISEGFFQIIKAVFTNETVHWSISLSLGTLMTMPVIIIAAVVIVQLICKKSFEKTWSTPRVVAGALVYGIVAAGMFHFGKHIVFHVNFFAACAAVILLFAIHKVLEAIDDPS